MRAVQVVAPGHAEFVEAPKPEPAPGEVLVRIREVSLCGSDVWMLHYAPPERYPFAPGTSGHEVVGVVEEVNGTGTDLKPGDEVLALVVGQVGMADYCTIPFANALPLPGDRPSEEYLQAQQLGTVIYACKFLPGPVVGKNVAVIGQGSAGLWWDFMMRRMGARRVIGLDLLPHRLMLPPRYGATHTVNNAETDAIASVQEICGGELADVVIVAAGEAEAVRLAPQLLRSHGDIFFFGIPHEREFSINYYQFFSKYPRMKMAAGALKDPGHGVTWQALELIHSGEIDVGPVITHRLPFESALEAYELQHTRDEGAVKIVVQVAE